MIQHKSNKITKKVGIKAIILIVLLLSIGIFVVKERIISIDIDASSNIKTPSNYKTISDNQSVNLISLSQSGGKVFFLFTSSWCSTCSPISNLLKVAAIKDPQIQFFEINIDDNRDLANKYNITLTPSAVVINNGEVNTFETSALNNLSKILTIL